MVRVIFHYHYSQNDNMIIRTFKFFLNADKTDFSYHKNFKYNNLIYDMSLKGAPFNIYERFFKEFSYSNHMGMPILLTVNLSLSKKFLIVSHISWEIISFLKEPTRIIGLRIKNRIEANREAR